MVQHIHKTTAETRQLKRAKGFAINDNRPQAALQAKRLTGMNPIQRIKIKLKDEDPILMGRLRNVPIANEGNEKLDQVGDAKNAQEIGSSENIILEGHGYTEESWAFGSKTVSQGGITPDKLAAIACNVPKPKDWDGNIILAGCSTGELTESVSKEYFKLTNKSVNVIGTLKNIRVGSKEDGTNFIGSDWTSYPKNDRPTDLAFIDEVEKVTKDFWTNIIKLDAFAKELKDFVEGTTNSITLSIKPIEETALKITSIDNDSKSVRDNKKSYKLDKRKELLRFFAYCMHLLGQIDFFIYPDKVQSVTDKIKEEKQYKTFHTAIGLLAQQNAMYSEIIFYLTGLKLKEIDLFDKNNTKHSKLKRTKKGMIDYLDTWENE